MNLDIRGKSIEHFLFNCEFFSIEQKTFGNLPIEQKYMFINRLILKFFDFNKLMVNTCKLLIQKGPNKGKLCCDVHKSCMHNFTTCPHCQMQFSYTSKYNKHLQKCTGAPQAKVSIKPKQKIALNVTQVKPKVTHSDDSLQPVPLHVPQQPVPLQNSPETAAYYQTVPASAVHIVHVPQQIPYHHLSEVDDLREKMQQITERLEMIGCQLEVIKEKPMVTNYNTFIGIDAFDILIRKMGRQQAVNFIASSASVGKPINIFRKIYLDNRAPEQYPIACNNGNFRYLDNNGKLVENDGREMAHIIKNQVHTAMIKATNELITQNMNGNSVDQLYEIYDIGKIQTFLAHINKVEMIQDIIHEVNNPYHPFFTQGVPALVLTPH